MFGSLSVGSAIWDKFAALGGLPAAHILAGLGALVAVPPRWRRKLETGAAFDLTPSMHWATPVLSDDVDADRAPVLVTVEYQVKPDDRGPFLEALERLGIERRRDGAFEWQVFEDLPQEAVFSKRSNLTPGLSIRASTSRSLTPIASSSNSFINSNKPATAKVTHLIGAFRR